MKRALGSLINKSTLCLFFCLYKTHEWPAGGWGITMKCKVKQGLQGERERRKQGADGCKGKVVVLWDEWIVEKKSREHEIWDMLAYLSIHPQGKRREWATGWFWLNAPSSSIHTHTQTRCLYLFLHSGTPTTTLCVPFLSVSRVVVQIVCNSNGRLIFFAFLFTASRNRRLKAAYIWPCFFC